jgi:hypothetical protein
MPPPKKRFVIQRCIVEELTIELTAAQRKKISDQKLIEKAAETPLTHWEPVEVDYNINEVFLGQEAKER